MTYIDLGNNLPGIRGLVTYRPDAGEHLYALAQMLLSTDSTLSRAERELIAAYVSSLNECKFCTQSHAAASRFAYKEKRSIVDDVLRQGRSDHLDSKMNLLLEIAGKVQQSGRLVSENLIHANRATGATDLEIHDTVLIAAVFCMFNRYVDGLQTFTPTESEIYAQMGEHMVTNKYQFPKK
jgi:uncharacterized peroxidase-related enzyme